MRLLVLDHHFSQDIDALRQAAGEEIEFDQVSYEWLRSEALHVLPGQVADGLEAFAAPELEPARRRYSHALRELLEDRFSSRPFDALLAPSDTFFYLRAAPAILHSLGVPFLVAQKETTISEHTMREHAEQLRRFAPPLADRMTVCSERHRQFWLRAGGDPRRILVTGQPRFDYYKRPWLWPRQVPFGAAGEPSVLFLSYAVDAYHPEEGTGRPPWLELHRQTEDALTVLAGSGWRVLVKPHPQQAAVSIDQWQARASDLWGRRLFAVPAHSDVRPLIAAADAVVGFQSTAMLEAMLAGRPVLYTGWDPTATRLGDDLIPFERWSQEITVVRRAGELAQAIVAAAGARCSRETLRRRRRLAEHYLGPLDGKAATRTIEELCGETAHWASQRGLPEARRREMLAHRRRPLRIGRRRRMLARSLRRRLGAVLGR
jgi:hypothetical protein